MKRLLKWIFRIAIGLAVLGVILLLSLDSILKTVVEHRVRKETGMEAKIGKFSFGLTTPAVTMENIKLYNTAEFGGTPLLDIPELHVEYDRAQLAQRKLHVTLLRIKLAEVDVVKNEAGRTNIASLLAAVPKTAGGGDKKLTAEGFEFTGIDVLNVSVGKVRYLDLKDRSQNREWNIALENQVLKNVKTPGDLGGLAVLIVLRSGGNLPGLPLALPGVGAIKAATPPPAAKR